MKFRTGPWPSLGLALCLGSLLILGLACQPNQAARPSPRAKAPAASGAAAGGENFEVEARLGATSSPANSVSVQSSLLSQGFKFLGLPALDESFSDTGDRPVQKSKSRPGTKLSGFDPGDRLLQNAVSAGNAAFNSWAEGWLNNHGRARINVNVSSEGNWNGSADFLSPIYDSEATAVFYQMGLRTMTNDRLIGNLGAGQRFFFGDEMALGYNLFLDYDFKRGHTRGGAGLEVWKDWLRLASNIYTPLSGWKDSPDFNGFYVEERPARGWDVRLTGYLPFYPNLAVTGAMEQWYGAVGAFGHDEFLKYDPKVWSAGLAWTPVPAVTVNADQRFSGSKTETQVGLTFNYLFGVPLENQFTPARVAESRTIDGSRHDFVDRQYDMVLAYRAKDGRYHIKITSLGGNRFQLTLVDGLGNPVPGQIVIIGG